MRQAIEEKFILDVLQNYTSYKLAFKLAHNGKDFDREQLNAIMEALDAHTAMSTLVLNSPAARRGLQDFLLNHAPLYEALRAKA